MQLENVEASLNIEGKSLPIHYIIIIVNYIDHVGSDKK